MRKIRARFELTEKAVSVDRRYRITVGDGFNSTSFGLAPKDQFSDPRWEFLLGDYSLDFTWHSSTDEGMYVNIYREYVNPNFGFTPEEYVNRSWLIDEPNISTFRLYNPFLAHPCLNWLEGDHWGSGQPFSEGDQFNYAWSFSDWETKLSEDNVQYTVKRLDDSDDFKEFLIRLD